MQYITLFDYLLLPLYLLIFYIIVQIKSKKYEDTKLKKYFIAAFFLHMAGSVLYAMMVQYYYGYGDSFGFYKGGLFLRKAIDVDINNLQLFFTSGKNLIESNNIVIDTGLDFPSGISIDSNLTIMKISTALSYVSFNRYLIISLFFALFSFAGIWRMYCTFNEIIQGQSKKLLAYTILYMPSICFWGSGLTKDTLCLGALGFIISLLYRIFIHKKISIKNVLAICILFYLIYILKSHIASILAVSAALSYIIYIFSKNKKNIFKFFFLCFILLICFIFLAINLSDNIKSIIEESKSQIEIFKGAYAYAEVDDENSLAGFEADDFDISFSSLILRSPLAISSVLFRPFLWETKKIIMLFSALESFLMLLSLLFIIYKCGMIKFIQYVLSNPYIFFAFIFIVLLGAVIGFTTFNFGTLVRYRLPLLPFYFFLLIFIYNKKNQQNISQV